MRSERGSVALSDKALQKMLLLMKSWNELKRETELHLVL